MPVLTMRNCGFTLLELVVTMVIIGILAVTVLPRFEVLGGFDAAGYADQTRSLLRYGQKSAVAQRRWVAVNVGANPPTICSQTAFPVCAANCVGGANIAVVRLPGGTARAPQATTTLGGGNNVLCFDALGRPIASGTTSPLAAAATLTISDQGTLFRTITVEAETGYIR